MTTHLARYVQRAREARGLSPQALAALLGYRNLDKGANRVLALEREGQGSKDFLALLVRALDLQQMTVDTLVQVDDAHDRMAFEDWAWAPVEPVLLVLPESALHTGIPLPLDAQHDEELALAFARREAVARAQRAALIWSRRVTHWIRADGTHFRTWAVRARANTTYTPLPNGRHIPY